MKSYLEFILQCGIVKTKPETKDIKSRNVLEEGDHRVFRNPLQGGSDDPPPLQFLMSP